MVTLHVKHPDLDLMDGQATVESITEFLTAHDVKLAYINTTPDGSFVLQAEGSERALIFNPQTAVLAIFPGTQDFMLLHPQLVGLFYE